MRLSPNFTLSEATLSQEAARRGIDNSLVSYEILHTAIHTATQMELVRTVLEGNPITINSWIRCLELNRLLGSSDTSQHVKGEAVDFICPKFGSPIDICRAIILSGISFDQLIYEHTWVHISFNIDSTRNRGQVLTLLAKKDPVTGKNYALGLTDKQGKAL